MVIEITGCLLSQTNNWIPFEHRSFIFSQRSSTPARARRCVQSWLGYRRPCSLVRQEAARPWINTHCAVNTITTLWLLHSALHLYKLKHWNLMTHTAYESLVWFDVKDEHVLDNDLHIKNRSTALQQNQFISLSLMSESVASVLHTSQLSCSASAAFQQSAFKLDNDKTY